MQTHRSPGCDPCVPDCVADDRRRIAYYAKRPMPARDWRAEQHYHMASRHLVNRRMFGCGVVCGLEVRVDGCGSLVIAEGFAFDARGRELALRAPLRRSLADLIRGAHRGVDEWIVCLEYCEVEARSSLSHVSPDDCGEERAEWIHDGVRVSLVQCGSSTCCKPNNHECPTGCEERECGEDTTGAMRRWLHDASREACADGCGDACVPIARLRLRWRECELVEAAIDDRFVPPLVVPNRTLVRWLECALASGPRVVDVSWREHLDPDHAMTRDRFLALLKKGFSIHFDRDMDPTTLNDCTVRIEAITLDRRSMYRIRREIPLEPLHWRGQVGPCRYELGLRPVDAWFDEEQSAGRGELDFGGRIEITVAGGRVKDRHGNGLDGEAIDRPSGNGRPGGDFVSCFHLLESQRPAIR